jgi:hypothetical protein
VQYPYNLLERILKEVSLSGLGFKQLIVGDSSLEEPLFYKVKTNVWPMLIYEGIWWLLSCNQLTQTKQSLVSWVSCKRFTQTKQNITIELNV